MKGLHDTLIVAGSTPPDGPPYSDDKLTLLARVRGLNAFTADNHPHGEHDFGAIEYAGVRYFWKIEYYDLATHTLRPTPPTPPSPVAF